MSGAKEVVRRAGFKQDQNLTHEHLAFRLGGLPVFYEDKDGAESIRLNVAREHHSSFGLRESLAAKRENAPY